MNKVSRLAALLLAVLLFAFAGAALAEEADVDLAVDGGAEDVVYTGGMEVDGSVDDIRINALYGVLMNGTNLQAMCEILYEGDNFLLLYSMSEEQLQSMYDHAEAIFAAIENPTDDDINWHEEFITIIGIVMDDMGFMVESAYALIAAAESLEEMWAIMSAEENAAGLEAMTYFEIEELRHKAHDFNGNIYEPTEVEARCYLDILDLLATLVSNKQDKMTYATEVSWTGNVNPLTVNSGQTYEVTLNDNVNLLGEVVVKTGGKLTITTTGEYTIRRINEKGNLSGNNFFAITGGELVINGGEKGITLKDGKGATGTFRVESGTLNLNNVTIDNCINTSSANSMGGGAIAYRNSGSISSTIENCTINNCHAREGSAIMFMESCKGAITLRNTTISGCNNTVNDTDGKWGGTIRTQGGANCTLTIDGCTIENNESVVQGGGIYWNACGTSAGLTITGTENDPTIIRNNSAGTQGGGVHFGGKELTIGYTQISGNSAPNGGGLSMSPYNYGSTEIDVGSDLTIGDGMKIENNTATGLGGGIYMQISSANAKQGNVFSITVVGNAEIIGNAASNGGAFAVVQETGTKKYNAAVKINGGIISGNTASTNGGAIYISRNYSTAYSNYKLDVDITGGEIYGNTAATSGGAIYITDNASSANVTVSGGEIGVDGANSATNGGAIYLQGGNFTMSGGTAAKNTATQDGGAVFVNGGNFEITGGTMDGNTATASGGAVFVNDGETTIGLLNCSDHAHPVLKNNSAVNGGAIYVAGKTPIMHCGELNNNTATADGGAVYVDGGGFTMHKGTATSNSAVNGGAIYVKGGAFTMNDGSMTKNNASADGGAAYVTGGNFTMMGGTLGGSGAGNTALNGGAVYVIGGNFNMISGTMTHNKAIEKTAGQAEAGNQGYGGAVYAAKTGEGNGAVVVGVQDCNGEGATHSVTYIGLAHPVVTNNEAEFGGAFAVNGGSVSFYCGKVNDNRTDSDGTGMNVFMQDGAIIHYIKEAVIGSDTNHGMVSTGGELTVHYPTGDGGHDTITLIYHANLDNPEGANFKIIWEGTAPEDYYLNLPYCPTDWQDWQDKNKLRFVGWTRSADEITSETIRSNTNFDVVGKPVEITDTDPDQLVNSMTFYAVWAPQTSNIHYAYIKDGESIVHSLDHNGAQTYDYTINESTVNIGTPVMAGYTFDRWILYAEYGTDCSGESTKVINISNWDSDAKSKPARPTLYSQIEECKVIEGDTLTTLQSFGDITLVAVFDPAFGMLTIEKVIEGTIEDANVNFLFNISGTADSDKRKIDIDVVVNEFDANKSSVKLFEVPVGTYTVKEDQNWSWRYSIKQGTSAKQQVTIDPDHPQTLTFTNEVDKTKWLDDEAQSRENQFTVNTGN